MNDVRPKILNLLGRLALGLLIPIALVSISAHADDKKPAGNGKGGSKRTTINFEDQLVEGQTQKPDLLFLMQQRNSNFKRLIKMRENFLPEMRKTSEDISHSAGKGTEE